MSSLSSGDDCFCVDARRPMRQRVALAQYLCVWSWPEGNECSLRRPLASAGVGLLSRVRTTVPSSVQTPASQPAEAVTVRKKISRGGFGGVYRVWNVSTGEQFALKKPKKRWYNGADWEKEIVIMERIDHISPDKPVYVVLHRTAFADLLLETHRIVTGLLFCPIAVAAPRIHARGLY